MQGVRSIHTLSFGALLTGSNGQCVFENRAEFENWRCQWAMPGCASWTNWWSVSMIGIVSWVW